MSKQALLIDNISFAKKNERISGEFPIGDFTRLQELIQSTTQENTDGSSGTIYYELQGKLDAVGQCILHLLIKANFTTFCQRCLSPMLLTLNLHFNYLIGEINDADVDAFDVDNGDDYDLQQANKAMDLMALIEDELIMAMPIAPMHEHGCTQVTTQSGEKPNPFAALKSLIKS